MKAVVVKAESEHPSLEVIDVEVPTPGPDQLLLAVRASALNRTDLRRVQQHYAAAKGPQIAGLELAGEIVACGDNVTGFSKGDRVMAMAPNAYAEFALADARTAMAVPPGIEWIDAAAIPVWYLTAHNALIGEAGMSASKSVLITAAASGIGIASIQLAKLFEAASIIGTSSSSAKFEKLYALGLDHAIIPSSEPLGAKVRDLTDGKGVDIIIDMVGGGLLAELIDASALGGTIVSVGRLGGFTDTIDLDKLALKRIKLVGVTFRTLDLAGKIAIRDAAMRDLGPALSNRTLKPVIDRRFALSEALAAQEYMKKNRHFGKIVLVP